MAVVGGIDLGGHAVNYTLLDDSGNFLIDGLFEHPSLAREGPEVCVRQIVEGFERALAHTGVPRSDLVAVGLDTPGPASAAGVLNSAGSTNFFHPGWPGFDLRGAVERALGLPVSYLNDGNAAALWGHYVLFGERRDATSVSAIIGTGLGGGIVVNRHVVTGANGFGGEVGHVLIPYQAIAGIEGLHPRCNCGRAGDLESLCSLTAITNSLLPYFLERYPSHELHGEPIRAAAKRVRGLAERGDEMCREIFRVQAHALALFFDQMIMLFDPDGLVIGGGAIEASAEFREWFVGEVRRGMPEQLVEQASLPIVVMPNGDAAGARGAAVDARNKARRKY